MGKMCESEFQLGAVSANADGLIRTLVMYTGLDVGSPEPNYDVSRAFLKS